MPVIHRIVSSIDSFTDRSGRLLAWLALAMALVTAVVVVMRYGENALEVIDRVKKRLKELKGGLPEGVIDIAASPAENLANLARAKDEPRTIASNALA